MGFGHFQNVHFFNVRILSHTIFVDDNNDIKHFIQLRAFSRKKSIFKYHRFYPFFVHFVYFLCDFNIFVHFEKSTFFFGKILWINIIFNQYMNKYNIKMFVPTITRLIKGKISKDCKTRIDVTNIDDKKLFNIISKEMLIN